TRLTRGAATAALSVAVGLPLAWAVSRTNVPAKRFIHLTAVVSYLTPPFLTAIAFVNLWSPRAGLVNRFVRDVLGMPALTFDVFSMAGLILVTMPHTFPFVYLLAASALESVDASMEESAQILGAGRWRTALACTWPLGSRGLAPPRGRPDARREPAPPVRLAGVRRPPGPFLPAPHPHLCPFRLPATVRPGLGAVARLRGADRRRALPAAPLPRAALVRDPQR